MTFRLTTHAKEELARRQVSSDVFQAVLDHPEQVVPERGGRKAYQSRVEIRGIMYLVRAIVDDRTEPAVVVTAYRTSKLRKYWR
jgi:hypothetical protein